MCGQTAWILTAPAKPDEVRSSLTADYSPWTNAFFPGLNPDILIEALRDREGGGWMSPRQVMDCFLLKADCEVRQGAALVPEGTSLRIANDREPDFDQPDGYSFALAPGMSVILDLRESPILVDGSTNPGADVLIVFIGSEQQRVFLNDLSIAFALKPEGEWFPLMQGGDQMHNDSEVEIPYSNEIAAAQGNEASSEDALVQQSWGIALDLDASITQAGLYGWMQIGLSERAEEPLNIDAIIVLEGDS
jgi:hypothetical protein